MIQNRSVVQSVDERQPQPSPEEIRTAFSRLDELSAEHAALQTALAGLPPQRQSKADEEFMALSEQLKKNEAELGEAFQGQVKSSRSLAAAIEKNAKQKQQNEAIPKAVSSAEAALEGAKAEFSELAEAKQETMRIPRVRASGRSTALVLVVQGSVYLAGKPSLFDNSFDSKQVKTVTLENGAIQLTPIIGTGWELGTPTGQLEFQQIVHNAKSRGDHLTLAIWPDCYEDFATLRDIMIEEGVMYQLWPQSEDEQLVVYRGGGSTSVQ